MLRVLCDSNKDIFLEEHSEHTKGQGQISLIPNSHVGRSHGETLEVLGREAVDRANAI